MVYKAAFIGGEQTILLKKSISKILYYKKIDQVKISDILKLSQPMVSNYCSSKEKIPNNISHIAEQISEQIINGKTVSFHTCINFSDDIIEGIFHIATKNEIINDENNEIRQNLNQAFFMLKGKNIYNLIPEIKINIAMSKDQATNQDDVAAFLNGFIIADDKITGNNGIRFGKSKHLSSLLLDLKKNLNINAIMNIAYFKEISKCNLKIDYLSKDYNLMENKKSVDILIHKGDFGIEPCAYILGKDAVDVSKKLLQIINGFTNE